MHYIIGTLVYVAATAPAQTSGPRSVTAKPIRSIKSSTPFEFEQPYSLQSVRYNNTESVYEYLFVNENTGEPLGLKFKTSREADLCIANALGQLLPDYDKFYKNSTG